MNDFVYVDCETTGLTIWKKRKADECVSVSILDDNGNSLFHSLIKPLKIKSWGNGLYVFCGRINTFARLKKIPFYIIADKYNAYFLFNA